MTMQPDELKQLRKSVGLSQGELAGQLGLSQGFIGEMERGEKPIEARTALQIGQLLALQKLMNETVAARDGLLDDIANMEGAGPITTDRGHNVVPGVLGTMRARLERLNAAIEDGRNHYSVIERPAGD